MEVWAVNRALYAQALIVVWGLYRLGARPTRSDPKGPFLVEPPVPNAGCYVANDGIIGVPGELKYGSGQAGHLDRIERCEQPFHYLAATVRIGAAVSPRLTVRQFYLTLCVMSTLTITAKGQVTLRKDILKHLGVAPGEQVSVEKLPDGRVEVKAAPTAKISDIFDYLKKPGRGALSVDEMNRIVARGWAGQGRAGRK